jgi:hypothetical protein
MVVISNLSLTFGNSSDYGYKRQLMSSSCFRKEPLFVSEEDTENKIKQVLPNDNNELEDEPIFLPKATSKRTSVQREKTLWQMEKRNDITSIGQSRKIRIMQPGTVPSGRISTRSKVNGYRIECDKKSPEPSAYSISLPVEVSTTKWM